MAVVPLRVLIRAGGGTEPLEQRDPVTSDAASFTLKPCENEKDQNLRSVRPWLEPCSSSFSPSIFTCSGLMCEYCCLQTSSGRPMWVRREFIA